MKIKSFIVAASAAVLVACGGGADNTPEGITKAFVKAMSSKDFKEAAGYCTSTSAKVVEGMEAMAGMMPETSLEKEEVKCETTEDKATCKFCCAAGKGEETYNLVKEGDKWKVDFVKAGAGAGESTEAPVEEPAVEEAPADTNAVVE